MWNPFGLKPLTKDLKTIALPGCFLLLCLGVGKAAFANPRPITPVEALSHACLDQVSQGDFQTAVSTCQTTITAARAANEPRLEGYAAGNLGTAHLHLEDYPQAIREYQQALTIAAKIEDSELAVSALVALGSAHLQLEQPQQALEFYQQAFDLAQTHHAASAAIAAYNLGLTYERLHQPQQALDYYRQSLKIAQAIHDPLLEAYAWSKLSPTSTAQDLP